MAMERVLLCDLTELHVLHGRFYSRVPFMEFRMYPRVVDVGQAAVLRGIKLVSSHCAGREEPYRCDG